jgi:hypothetical protein
MTISAGLPGLRRLATLPVWLRAALSAGTVLAALVQAVPDVELEDLKVRRLVLDAKAQRWVGTYQVATADGKVQLLGSLAPPHLAAPGSDGEPGAPFGTEGWHGWLPELGLDLRTQPPETVLSAMDELTDPEQARAVMQRVLARPVAACAVDVLAYKPGSRAVLRYGLTYPPGTGGPATVIAKTYRKADKGQNAFDGMRALWRTSLASGDMVVIAEPVAFVPELKLLLQRPIPGSVTLESVLAGTFAAAGPVPADVGRALAASAVGLAAMHTSGATVAGTFRLGQRIGDAREVLDWLVQAVPAPELADDFGPAVERLERLDAELPTGPERPSHGTFDPEQVLLDGDRVGFIDFDDAAMAEAALDVGLFLASLPDLALESGGMGDPEPLLDRAAALGDTFVSAYEAEAPLSRERVELWQTTDHLVHALQTWTKAKPSGPGKDLAVLDHHLRHSRL